MKTNLVYISLAILLIIAGCGSDEITSAWDEGGLAIDGDGSDWSSSGLSYVEDVRGVIGVANTDTTLSLMFRFRDQHTARKAMMGGVTIWWNNEGKKSRDFGIRFASTFNPFDMMESMPSPGSGMGRGAEDNFLPKEGLLHPQRYLIVDDIETPLESLVDQGLKAASTYYNGFYTYEILLPLGSNAHNPYSIVTNRDDNLHLYVELGGMSDEDRKMLKSAMNERMGNRGGMGPGDGMGRRGGMGGKGGMSGRGGGGPGGRSGIGDMFEKEAIWFAIALAERSTGGNQA